MSWRERVGKGNHNQTRIALDMLVALNIALLRSAGTSVDRKL
jgi:hypothetical protein